MKAVLKRARYAIALPLRTMSRLFVVGVLVAGCVVWGGGEVASAAMAVNCPTDNLQTAIDNAAAGSTLVVNGTCTGNFELTKNLTLKGGGVLDGNNNGTVLLVDDAVTAKLISITVQHGNVSGQNGGGIFNHGDLTLQKSIVADNTATGSGAGIANVATLTVQSSKITGNTAGDVGGGIASFGRPGSATVIGSTFSSNSASYGSALEAESSLLVRNSTFEQNSGAGAIMVFATAGPAVIKYSTFRDNTSGGDSGALLNGATTEVVGSTFTGNSAAHDGGAIWNADGANLALKESTVRNNTAGVDGGGVLNVGTLTLRRTTITGNVPNDCSGCP